MKFDVLWFGAFDKHAVSKHQFKTRFGIVTFNVLWLFLAVPCVGLQYVIVVFLITYFLVL